jgi:hypothetical protein
VGGSVGGDAVVNYVIAVCLEGKKSVGALEHVYETRKRWVHSIEARMVEKWDQKDGRVGRYGVILTPLS